MQYKDNPAYQIAFTAFKGQADKEVHFYTPKDVMNGYHMSRKIAGQVQDMYGGSGMTRELLSDLFEQMEQAINSDEKNAQIRTKLSTLIANGKYRMKYPVDELCALRMAALYLFIEGEDPSTVAPHITERKVQIALSDPDAYAFFLTIGAEFMPSWSGLNQSLKDVDYIQARNEMIKMFSQK